MKIGNYKELFRKKRTIRLLSLSVIIIIGIVLIMTQGNNNNQTPSAHTIRLQAALNQNSNQKSQENITLFTNTNRLIDNDHNTFYAPSYGNGSYKVTFLYPKPKITIIASAIIMNHYVTYVITSIYNQQTTMFSGTGTDMPIATIYKPFAGMLGQTTTNVPPTTPIRITKNMVTLLIYPQSIVATYTDTLCIMYLTYHPDYVKTGTIAWGHITQPQAPTHPKSTRKKLLKHK